MPETRYLSGDGWRIGVLVDSDPRPGTAPTLSPTLGEYPIYDVPLYDVMAADAERNWRFCEALEQYALDRVVIDIGTGSRLFWARESLRFGARRVFAVEAMQESYRAASQLLTTLDERRRITLLHGESTALAIDPKAQLCVAEIIGSLAGAEGSAAVLSDAKQRHLTADAVIVPHQCRTRAAAVNFTKLFAGRSPAFSEASIPPLQRIFDWNSGAFDVRLRVANPASEGVLSDSAVVERLEFNGDLMVEQVADVQLTIARSGVVDGVLTWLEIECLPGQAPLDALRCESNWASIYLPLFETGVAVDAGDVLNLKCRTVLSEDGVHPDYHLSGRLRTTHGVHRGIHSSPYKNQNVRSHPIYQSLYTV
ncbi:MAG: class I SAM-dependent methyltransferase [Planctomycetota bacterium]